MKYDFRPIILLQGASVDEVLIQLWDERLTGTSAIGKDIWERKRVFSVQLPPENRSLPTQEATQVLPSVY